MITEFFLDLWLEVGSWVLSLMGDYDGLPTEIEGAVTGINSAFASASSFFGALDQWFPVGPFFAVLAVSLVVEIAIALIRGLRTVKQLLPFQ